MPMGAGPEARGAAAARMARSGAQSASSWRRKQRRPRRHESLSSRSSIASLDASYSSRGHRSARRSAVLHYVDEYGMSVASHHDARTAFIVDCYARAVAGCSSLAVRNGWRCVLQTNGSLSGPIRN